MVYQIYFGDRGMKHNVLFDIEVYLTGDGRCHWYSEIHSSAFGSAFINYFKSDDMKALLENDVVLSNMIEDSKELEELRGWLYERSDTRNTPTEKSLASKRHKKILAYVKEKVYAFADKYNLYVNED
jgi:hypothetical protein